MTALVVCAVAGAARNASDLVLTVAAKGAPLPAVISCQAPSFSGQSQVCFAPGSSFRWKGTVRDGAVALTGKLTGRCTTTGRADGALRGGLPDTRRPRVFESGFTLTEVADADANCSFVLAFPHGTLSGTAAVSSTLKEGGGPGTAGESVTISISGGTGNYAGRTGRGTGKVEASIPATTVYCETAYACRLPIPLVIPPVDIQSEAWHLSLR